MQSTEAREPWRGLITLIPREMDETASSETETAEILSGETHAPWIWKRIPPLRSPEPQTLKMVAPPPCMHQFVVAVTKLPGIKCVVVEEGEESSVHVTTFAQPVTEELGDAIYRIEADTIQRNPNFVFDFHVRRADEAGAATPGGEGSHYFAVWGGLDADPR